MTAAPLPPAGPALWVGGDVSAVPRLEQAGATFRDGDRAADPLVTLRARGATLFRLRLFLAPNGDEVQVNDLPYTIALAQRVRATGARLLLDFHYSDTWADPGRQLTPAAWADLPLPALEDTVEAYTRGVLQAMRTADVLPEFVQVGNEVDAGFLWPLGRLGAASDTAAFTRFSRLLRAGIRGVRSATTATDSVRIIIHHSQGADPERTAWFFDRLGGLDYDIIGLSYYPWWHGDIRGLRATLAQAVTRHEKDVMVVETAYPWRRGPAWLEGSAAMAWPMTPDGQRAFLREVAAAVADAPEGRGQGVVWWYPESIVTPGIAPWADGVLALFDGAGRILPAADVFTDVNIGRRD